MAYFLFKCWHEKLFFADRAGIIPQKARIDLRFVPISYENIGLVRELRGDVYEGQFKDQLDMGDFGFYAYDGDTPVGYGWVKHEGSRDYFFRVKDSCCYLCRFFVHESMRGKGIYPEIITRLIERESNCDRFYIAVERGNDPSERGLRKVGFKFVKEYGFVRGFKRTFNKKTLN